MTRATAGILVNGYLSRVGMHAGGNVHAVETARRLTGFDVVFYGPRSAREAFLRAVPAASYVTMPDFPWLPDRMNLLARGIAGIFRRGALRRASVLLATSHHVPDTFPALAARHDRTVVLVHHLIGRPSERNGGALYNRLSWLGQELSLLFVRRFAARIAFVSNHVRREAAGAAGNQPAYLVPNGVDVPPDLPHVAFAQRRGGIYVGRLHTMKRVADAIEAWSRLPAAPADCQLVIAGGDQDAYARELQTLARDIGIGHRVRFAGHVDDATKWSLLAHAAIFVFPSAEEGWGLVIAEAMAAGLPCVTYDLPVYDDIFTRGRIAVPLGDVDALARACAALLADDARRERLSEEGRALAQTFSWDAAARNLATALTFDD